MNNEEQELKSKRRISLIAIIAVIAIIVLWFCTYFWVHNFGGFTIKKASEIGDAFGGLNTLFSGLAFVGVIYAILLQQEELGLQRRELSETRQELRKSAEAHQLQVKLQALTTIVESENNKIVVTT